MLGSEAGLCSLPIGLVPVAYPASGKPADTVCALETSDGTATPECMIAPVLARPRLRLAPGSRYPMETPVSVMATTEPTPARFPAVPGNISLPERKAMAAGAGAAPGAGGPLPITTLVDRIQPLTWASDAPESPQFIAQPNQIGVIVPQSRLKPIVAAPAPSDMPVLDRNTASAPPAARPTAPAASATPAPHPPVRKIHVWTPAADFLRNAPRDLKMLAFAIPVLLGLALHPSLPKVRIGTPATTSEVGRSVERVLNDQLLNVKQTMTERAAVALDEDFRSGLDDWASRDDATTEWSFDSTGFVRPGPLALYRPSLALKDYQLQFLGMIDKKALSWVVRAADFNNYYVVKLVVMKAGPLPTIGVTRYAVIDGKADARIDSSVPVEARADMLYRVRLDVEGDMFVLVVQGQVIDSWSEPRLNHGGVGFFTARGESSRLRWVQITHQYDMLGRLCAYLAPYNISSNNGSSQP
jgi:hypothetical protein